MDITFNTTVLTSPATPFDISFGDKTEAGKGGVTLDGAVTGGTASGYTQDGSNVITPTTTGSVTAGTITTDNGSTYTVTIDADTYHVASLAELESAAEDTLVALGDTIKMRNGIYNPLQDQDDAIRRATPPTGTWNGSNYVVIEPDTPGEVTLSGLKLDGTLGTAFYMHLRNLNWDCDMIASRSALIINNNASYIKVSDCTFAGTPSESRTLPTDLNDAILGGTSGSSNIIIEDNVFTDVKRPIKIVGPDCTVQRNTMTVFWDDGIQITPPSNRLKVNYNVMTEKRVPYTEVNVVGITSGNPTVIEVDDATGISTSATMVVFDTVGWSPAMENVRAVTNVTGNLVTINFDSTGHTAYTSGGKARWKEAHGDFIQGVFGAATAGEIDDMELLGNICDTGFSVDYLPTAQGIFLQDNSVNMDNVTVRGNICILKGLSGISMKNPTNCTVINNTVIRQLGSPSSGTTSIGVFGTTTGTVVGENVSNSFNIQGTATDRNNVVIDYVEADYQAAFDNPPLTETVANTLVAYNPKAGGTIDTLTPDRGAIPAQSFVDPYTFTP